MSHNPERNYEDTIKYNKLCEAQGCKEKATDTVVINLGKYGCLSFQVCQECVGKFDSGRILQ